jgi:hypothetical protein
MREEGKMARHTKRSSGRKKTSGNRGTRAKGGTRTPARAARKVRSKTREARSKNGRSKRKRSTASTSKRRRTTSNNPRGKGGSAVIVEPISEIADRSDLDAVESATDHAKRDAEAMVGDELPGGTVAVPDNDRADDWANALGVERSPDSPVRTSGEILDARDRRRPGRHPEPKL